MDDSCHLIGRLKENTSRYRQNERVAAQTEMDIPQTGSRGSEN